MRERRPNLATVVGSGLAVVAAGSLLAFSSLAEQAGLQGLATGHIEPAAPVRGGVTRAIRLPAPAPAPGEPADPLEQIVRDAFARVDSLPAPEPRVVPGAPVTTDRRPEKKEKKEKPRRRSEPSSTAIAFAPREVADDGETTDGPPYGNAYGHHKNPKKPEKPEKSKAPKPEKHGRRGGKAGSGPMYARGAADDSKASKDEPTTWEPVKSKKAKKAKHPGGRGNGHSKHGHDNGKGKGHSKHGH